MALNLLVLSREERNAVYVCVYIYMYRDYISLVPTENEEVNLRDSRLFFRSL